MHAQRSLLAMAGMPAVVVPPIVAVVSIVSIVPMLALGRSPDA